MEKFAVDLDKVLDEFEINEDRAEQLAAVKDSNPVAASVIRSTSHNHQASQPQYLHPAFESISLADADFAAEPESTELQHYNNNQDDTSTVPLNPSNIGSVPSWQQKNQPEQWNSHNLIYPQVVDRSWQQNVIIQERNGIGTKLNVSGVFSSLNEYINAGSHIDMANTVPQEENGNYKLEQDIDTAADAVVELQNEDRNHNLRWKKCEVSGSFADVIPAVYQPPQPVKSDLKTVPDETPDLVDSTLSNSCSTTHDQNNSNEHGPVRNEDMPSSIPLPDVTTSGSLVHQNAGTSDSTFDLVTSHNAEGGSSMLDLVSHKDDSFEDASSFQDCSETKAADLSNTASSTFTEVTGNSSFGSSGALQISDFSALSEDISTPEMKALEEDMTGCRPSPGSSPKLKSPPVVGFNTLEDMSDSELHQYLQELDDDDEDDGDNSNQKPDMENTSSDMQRTGSVFCEAVPKQSIVGMRTSGGSMRVVSNMEENFCDAEGKLESAMHPSSPDSTSSSDSPSLQFISSTNSPEMLPLHVKNEEMSSFSQLTTVTKPEEGTQSFKPEENSLPSCSEAGANCETGHADTKPHCSTQDSDNISKIKSGITSLVSIQCQQNKASEKDCLNERESSEEIAALNCTTKMEDMTEPSETSQSSAAEMKSSQSLETGSAQTSTKTDLTSTYDLTSSQDTDFGSAENVFSTPELVSSIDSDAVDRKTLPVEEEREKSVEMSSGDVSAIVSSRSGDVSYSEVQSCLVRAPKDGSTINVLGEEERPSRPKYLFLPSKIVVENEQEPSANSESPQRSGTVGPPGETPSVESRSSCAEVTENLALSSPDVSESSSIEQGTVSPPPILAAATPLSDETLSDLLSPEEQSLGKLPPFWVPDAEAPNCMLCEVKFTVLKRRHHCRACGKVLCSKCCGLKARLEYMDNAEARVCLHCHNILSKVMLAELEQGESASGSPSSPNESGVNTRAPLGRQPNPNNPMEYCSTIPPLEQAASVLRQPPPSVLVPVGVLKREGSTRTKDVTKQVMFSDGIRPGGDLTDLDGSGEPRLPYRRPGRVLKRVGTPPGPPSTGIPCSSQRAFPPLDAKTQSYIPADKGLPPLVIINKGDIKFEDVIDHDKQMALLRSETEPATMFAINRNLYVSVKICDLDCCVNRVCWCFTTNGMSCVGQDEILIILQTLPDEATVPRDIFLHLNSIYQDASRGNTVSELGHTVLSGGSFLDSTEHGGFIYIRPSFQCLQKLILPSAPYLVGVLVHRWETPWARLFPIRLMLRLGAEYRYYPCMLVSIRNRKPVYWEIGHTIINLLADFRNLSYTLPSVRGLLIHMEDRQTSILLPKNRYDQVTRAMNNSNDHVLALAANFSLLADSHLVCIQSNRDESYHTQAINIHNKPRKVTGASFVVFNGALKTSSNLTAKSSIVEDGLMVQITPDTMQALRTALRNMQDFSIGCGPAGAAQPDELVAIKWVQDDKNFNVGVKSCIDGRALDGVPSIRVHNGTDYMGSLRFIRWTEVFILQSDEGSGRSGDPLDISRLSESLAKASCLALVKLLDLLAQAGLTKLAVRATIHPENVGYEAGSNGEKLPPIYMDSLDNELVPVLHKAASLSPDNTAAILELIFHIMLQ